MGGLDGCRGGGGRLSLVVLVSEKPNLVSEKSGKSQGILFICVAGNPVYSILSSINIYPLLNTVLKKQYSLFLLNSSILFSDI